MMTLYITFYIVYICKFCQSTVLTYQLEKLESVQYSAALAVVGAWRGTPREKLYSEFGRESLNLPPTME